MHVLVWLFAIVLSLGGVPPAAPVPVGVSPAAPSSVTVSPAAGSPVAPPAAALSLGEQLATGISPAESPVVERRAARRLAGVTRAAPVPTGSFRWPLDGPPYVVRRFDPPPDPWLAGHRGVDLAAAAGATVRAAGAGTVHFAGRVAGRSVVSVNHPNGLRTTYEPLEPAVRAGQAVAAGDPIGTLVAGHGGCTAAACLHWGLRRGEEYLDPLALLGMGRVRLLPLGVQRDVAQAQAARASAAGARAGAPGGGSDGGVR